jgi:hypothetical protein
MSEPFSLETNPSAVRSGRWFRRGANIIVVPEGPSRRGIVHASEREIIGEEAEMSRTLTAQELIDPRIDVHAQKSLLRLSKSGTAEQIDALEMFQAVKSGTLAGIYIENQQVPAQRARQLGLGWWELIPAGKDSALIREPGSPPLIVFRDRLRSDPSGLDRALRQAWSETRVQPQSSPRLLALTDVPLALSWARQGLRAVEHLIALIQGGKLAPESTVFAEALAVHFKIRNVLALRGRSSHPQAQAAMQRLNHIRIIYRRINEALPKSQELFRDAPSNFTQIFPTLTPATPAFVTAGKIVFTSHFKPSNPAIHEGYGPPARAAMVLHMFVVIFDQLSSRADIHISEFAPAYDQQTSDQAIHNPSSYAAFGQHTCYGLDTRFGAATRHIQVPPSPGCL